MSSELRDPAIRADERTLYECLKFARLFPILGRHPELAWAHYRRLIQVADPIQRKALMTQTIREGWTGDQVAARVVELNAATRGATEALALIEAKPQPLLEPQRGTPGLHAIVERGDGLAVDLGFKLYWPLTTDQAKRFAKGDIVRIANDDSIQRAEDATKADLFTYAATLRRVVDGDTLVVALEVSPGVFIEQKLRLRGLDCPEMKTPEGNAAKRFVDALVAKTTAVVINTTKPDKYDRYLADVFLSVTCDVGRVTSGPSAGSGQAKGDGSEAMSEEIFLNNVLLENGHAVRKESWQFGDWGF